MRHTGLQVIGGLWLAWAAIGCELPRAQDPEQRDQAWRARVETAHAYAARKATTRPVDEAPAPVAAQTLLATPSALRAPEVSAQPAQAPPTKKRRARSKKAGDRALPPGRMELDVIQTPDGRGPKLIEISRTDEAPARGTR